MGWWETIRVRLARSMLSTSPWVHTWAGRTAVMRWKSESMADSESSRNWAELTMLSPASTPSLMATLSPNWGPRVTATDLKLPSPRASTSLSWLPVRITASLGTTSCGSPLPA
ncbi:hypothetical protein D3C75_1126820 [compost metagenome]